MIESCRYAVIQMPGSDEVVDLIAAKEAAKEEAPTAAGFWVYGEYDSGHYSSQVFIAFDKASLIKEIVVEDGDVEVVWKDGSKTTQHGGTTD